MLQTSRNCSTDDHLVAAAVMSVITILISVLWSRLAVDAVVYADATGKDDEGMTLALLLLRQAVSVLKVLVVLVLIWL